MLIRLAKVLKPREKWFWETLIGAILLAAVSFKHFSGITALDIATLVIFPVVFAFARRNQDLKRFLILIVLWLVAVLLSDTIHGVHLSDTTISMVLPALLALSTAMLAWLARNSRARLRAVVIAAVTSHIIYVVVFGTTYFTVNPWKYGLALPVTVLGLAVVAGESRYRRLLSVGVLAASGVYSFVNDFRSMSGLALAAIVLTFVMQKPPKPGRKFGMTKLFVGLIIVGYAGYGAYAVAASEGLLPAEAAAKYQQQVRQGNLLVAARPEVVGSFYAIKTSPLIGLGTGGELDSVSRSEAFDTLYKAGAQVDQEQKVRLFENGVNSHSLLFSAWVSAGVLGALPWAFIIYLAMRAIARRTIVSGFSALGIFWGLSTSWDVLFSPYQSHLHIVLAAFVVFMTWKAPPTSDTAPQKDVTAAVGFRHSVRR